MQPTKYSSPIPDSNIKLKQMCKKKQIPATKTEPILPQAASFRDNRCPFHISSENLKSRSTLPVTHAGSAAERPAPEGILEVHGTVRGSPVGPLLIHPPAQDLLHVNPVVKSAELHQLDHSPLAVSEQELQRGALGPLFQEAQFIIGHAPLAGKIPPVLHGRVARIQLYPDHI